MAAVNALYPLVAKEVGTNVDGPQLLASAWLQVTSRCSASGECVVQFYRDQPTRPVPGLVPSSRNVLPVTLNLTVAGVLWIRHQLGVSESVAVVHWKARWMVRVHRWITLAS
jgi:hypothetical protein